MFKQTYETQLAFAVEKEDQTKTPSREGGGGGELNIFIEQHCERTRLRFSKDQSHH